MDEKDGKSGRRRVLSVRAGDKSIKIPARLGSEEWEDFRQAAEREGRSVTGQISWLIRSYLAESGTPEGGYRDLELAPVLRVRERGEARADDEMRAYWLSRSPDERVAEVERLRVLGAALNSGSTERPGIERVGRVIRRSE